jgi:hypothetical protein
MSSETTACSEPKSTAEIHRLIDEVVLDELRGSSWERLRAHLSGCLACRTRYNKAVRASRMLAGGPAAVNTPSPSELARIGRAVLPPEPKGGVSRLLEWFAPVQRWSVGLVAAAAVIVIVPLVGKQLSSHKGRDAAEPEFQPRGGQHTGKRVSFFHNGQPERPATLRAFCLDGDKVQPLDPLSPPGTTALKAFAPKCALNAQLKLAVSNPGKYQRVFLVGVDADRSPKWYAPRPPESESVAAPQPKEGEPSGPTPIGASIRLGVNHDAGALRIYALFSDKPVTTAEVEAALSTVSPSTRVADLEALPLVRPDVVQRSLLVELTR